MRLVKLATTAFAVFCVLGAQSALSSGREYLVMQDVVAIRSAPRADASVVAHLRRGDMVVEFARRADWMKISVYRTVGKEGWVPRAAVQAAARTIAAPPASPEAAISEPFVPLTLRVFGSPARQFRGVCRLTNAQGEVERLEFKGISPSTYNFVAGAASCRVQKWDASGRLRVNLGRGGVLISSAETAAAYNWVRVRSDGPWGTAGGKRGAVRTIVGTQPTRPSRSSSFFITVN